MRQERYKAPAEPHITSINTDYVRSVQRRETQNKSRKVRLVRRLVAFSIFSMLLIGFLVSALVNSKQNLAEKQLQKEEVATELARVQEEQEMLRIQISKLNDDEYIGKLLRKEYFLSEEGEIIFSLPEGNEK